MKGSELIAKLKGFEDFELTVVVNVSVKGERPLYVEGELTFEDVTYSGNTVTLGVERP